MMSNILQRAVGFPIMRCRKRTVLVFSPAVFHRSHDAALHHSPDRICRYHAPITRACCEDAIRRERTFSILSACLANVRRCGRRRRRSSSAQQKSPGRCRGFLFHRPREGVDLCGDRSVEMVFTPDLAERGQNQMVLTAPTPHFRLSISRRSVRRNGSSRRDVPSRSRDGNGSLQIAWDRRRGWSSLQSNCRGRHEDIRPSGSSSARTSIRDRHRPPNQIVFHSNCP